MKKLVKFSFSGEDIDHQPESRPEIVSWGGGALSVTQENHHHGETSSNQIVVDDDVDSTLGLSTALLSISRNSAISPQDQTPSSSDLDHVFLISSNPTALYDHDDVDTTLRLGPPLWWLRQQSNGVDSPRAEDDDQNYLDSTLSFSPPVYNPTPLRWFRPQSNGVDSPAVDVDQNQETKKFSLPASTIKKSRNSNKKGRGGEEDQRRPLAPIEEIGGLLQMVESRGGSRPEFLYRKKLHASDMKRSQNRVFLNRGERVMEFLREEEAAAVNGGGKGLTIVGVDGGGKVYEKLVLTKWASLKMIVIKSDWMKVVDANKAEEGHVMEIWGYRENHDEPCLAFNFWRDLERDGDEGDNNHNHAASTSSSSNAMVS